MANVVLIFKKGKKKDPGNYRLVNLTSVPGKVMEKIILGNNEKHLKDNAVTGHSQHNFMRGMSCSSNLISFYDEVTHLADQGKPVDVILLDFSKAFDPVSHRILLDKMSSTQLDKHIMWWDDFSYFQNISPEFFELCCSGGPDTWSPLQDSVGLEAELTAAGAGPECPGDNASLYASQGANTVNALGQTSVSATQDTLEKPATKQLELVSFVTHALCFLFPPSSLVPFVSDLNECGLKPRPCKHRCMNTYGSYKCYCLNGYMLMPDGTCSNALSCLMANCQYGCDVLKGEVRCRCPSPGLQLGPDGRTCIEKPVTRPTARPTPEPTTRPTPRPTTQPTPGPTTRLTPKPTTRYVPVTTRPTTRYVPVTTRPVTTPVTRPPPPPQPTTIRPTLPPQRPPLVITEEPSQVPIETTPSKGIIDDNRIQPDPQKPRGDVFIPRQPGVSNNLFEILEIERGITADEFEANDDPGVLVHSCNFDSGLCGWIKGKDDDLHWEPVRDGSGGQYLTISDPKGKEGRAAHLILPLDHMAHARDLCLSFRHKVPGLHSGALQVFVRKNGAHGPAVWGRNGGHGWRQTHITLRGLGIKSVIFKGEKGKGRTGDIGLDDVILRRGRCSEEH
ncbi:nephronectin isoform X1 [Pitangus sulphuratus]|nr:nephronectin isoform X1 [Pitangus sulphuratus]